MDDRTVKGDVYVLDVRIALHRRLATDLLGRELPKGVVAVPSDELHGGAVYLLLLRERPAHMVVGKVIDRGDRLPVLCVLGLGLAGPAADRLQLAGDPVPALQIFIVAVGMDRTAAAVIGGEGGGPLG